MAPFEPPQDFDLLAPDQSVETRDTEFVSYNRFVGTQEVEHRIYYRRTEPLPTRPGFYRTSVEGNATEPRVIELLGNGSDWVDVSDSHYIVGGELTALQPLTPLLTEQEWAAKR